MVDERLKVMFLEGIKFFVVGGYWLFEMKLIVGGIDEFYELGVLVECM